MLTGYGTETQLFYFKTRTRTDYGVVLKITPKSPDIKTCISNQGNLSFEVLKILILINTSLHEKDNYDWIERNVP